jgi:hypothetical protein
VLAPMLATRGMRASERKRPMKRWRTVSYTGSVTRYKRFARHVLRMVNSRQPSDPSNVERRFRDASRSSSCFTLQSCSSIPFDPSRCIKLGASFAISRLLMNVTDDRLSRNVTHLRERD